MCARADRPHCRTPKPAYQATFSNCHKIEVLYSQLRLKPAYSLWLGTFFTISYRIIHFWLLLLFISVNFFTLKCEGSIGFRKNMNAKM